MKTKFEPIGIVYKVVHKQSGATYVGVTTKSLESRKQDHEQKARKGTGHYFHQAIATYGPEAFEWEQVDTASNLEELAHKERAYITEFKAFEEGYNSNSGGGLKKTVYQYDMESGALLNAFDSLELAASAVNAHKKSISRACLNVNNSFAGFYWSYILMEPFIPTPDKRRKTVEQIDVSGNVLATYCSVAEASRQTGISKSPIAKTCRGEQQMTGGFYWRYSNNLNEERYGVE